MMTSFFGHVATTIVALARLQVCHSLLQAILLKRLDNEHTDVVAFEGLGFHGLSLTYPPTISSFGQGVDPRACTLWNSSSCFRC